MHVIGAYVSALKGETTLARRSARAVASQRAGLIGIGYKHRIARPRGRWTNEALRRGSGMRLTQLSS